MQMTSRAQSTTIILLTILAFVLAIALCITLLTVRINLDGYVITRMPAHYELPSDFTPEDLAALNGRLEQLPADNESSSVRSCAVFSGNQLILLTTDERSAHIYPAFGRPLRPSPQAVEEVLRVHRTITQAH